MLGKYRKSRKGLSGAITALILVIAAVIISLIVVLYAFGLIPGITSSSIQVTQVGPAYLYTYSSSSGSYLILVATLSVSGKANVVEMVVAGSTFPVTTTSTYTVTVSSGGTTLTDSNNGILTGGTNSYVIVGTGSVSLAVGQTYTVNVVLSNGVSTTISAVYEGTVYGVTP